MSWWSTWKSASVTRIGSCRLRWVARVEFLSQVMSPRIALHFPGRAAQVIRQLQCGLLPLAWIGCCYLIDGARGVGRYFQRKKTILTRDPTGTFLFIASIIYTSSSSLFVLQNHQRLWGTESARPSGHLRTLPLLDHSSSFESGSKHNILFLIQLIWKLFCMNMFGFCVL